MPYDYESLLQGASGAALAELDRAVSRRKPDVTVLLDAADIIGVVSGVKPAAFVMKETAALDLLKQLGLVTANSRIGHLIYISKDKDAVERLVSLHERVWGKNAQYPNEQREIGMLLGYPETSTEYFIKRLPTVRTVDELPTVVIPVATNTVSEFFQQFIFSPEHFEEELAQYSEPLERAVRTLTPKTYRVMRRFAAKERRKAMWQSITRRFGL